MSSFSTAPYAEPLWLSRNISPYYKESHHRLQRETRKYVDKNIAPYCEEWERQGSVPREAINLHSELGYMAVSVYPLAIEYLQGRRLPGDIKAEDWDEFHDLIVIDEIARCGYLGVIWGLSCGNSIGAPPVVIYGNDEQKARLLPNMINGKTRFCLGVTEPEGGSDVANVTTTAERTGNVYVVNGSKKWITNGHFANYCTAAVRTGGPGRKGVSALVIPLDLPGVTCRKMANSGVEASGSTFIEFEDVEVPVENLLGKENEGFQIIMSNFNHERLWLACTSLRMARVCAQDSYSHAVTRETFGKPLISNQVIVMKVSSFGRAIDPVHQLMETIVFMLEQERKRKSAPKVSNSGIVPNSGYEDFALSMGGLIANLKVQAARTLEYVNREAQQIMGGAGYSRTGKGARIEQISRDVRVMAVGGGSEEILSEQAAKLEIKELMRIKEHSGRDSRL